MGDNSEPFPSGMELWDTVTNDIQIVDHPQILQEKKSRFFRPVITNYTKNSILVAGSKVFDIKNSKFV